MTHRNHLITDGARKARCLGLLVVMFGWLSTNAYGDYIPIVQDSFSDNSLNTNKWKIATPFPESAVHEQNERIELVNGGWLITQRQFDPVDYSIRVQGKVQFKHAFDSLTIVTRSESTPTDTGGIGRGIRFRIDAGDNGTLLIQGTGTKEVSKVVSAPVGEILEFAVTDAGTSVILILKTQRTPMIERLSASTSAGQLPSNFVAFVHRSTHTSRIFLDNVSIASSDDDDDGKPDSIDLCQDSDLNHTVVIDECDSGVRNRLDAHGCTISDIILPCEEISDPRTLPHFLSCIAQVTNDLRQDGLITAIQSNAIRRCAALSDEFEGDD